MDSQLECWILFSISAMHYASIFSLFICYGLRNACIVTWGQFTKQALRLLHVLQYCSIPNKTASILKLSKAEALHWYRAHFLLAGLTFAWTLAGWKELFQQVSGQITLSPTTIEFSPFDDPYLKANQPLLYALLFKSSLPNKFRFDVHTMRTRLIKFSYACSVQKAK